MAAPTAAAPPAVGTNAAGARRCAMAHPRRRKTVDAAVRRGAIFRSAGLETRRAGPRAGPSHHGGRREFRVGDAYRITR
jgi:hypothetical protein